MLRLSLRRHRQMLETMSDHERLLWFFGQTGRAIRRLEVIMLLLIVAVAAGVYLLVSGVITRDEHRTQDNERFLILSCTVLEHLKDQPVIQVELRKIIEEVGKC